MMHIDVVVEIDSGQIVEILGDSQEATVFYWWKVSWNQYIGWIADRTGSGIQILIFKIETDGLFTQQTAANRGVSR